LGASLVTTVGERLTYLPSVFTVLALVQAVGAAQRRWPAVTAVTFALTVAIASMLTLAEQQRWIDAGRVSQHTVAQLGVLPPDEPAILMNLPDTVGGVYALRNAVTPALALFHGWEDPALVWQATGSELPRGDEVVDLERLAAPDGQRWRLSLEGDDVADGAAWTQLFPRTATTGSAGIAVSDPEGGRVDVTVAAPDGAASGAESLWWASGGVLRRVDDG
jgi:hypothetical protein